MNSSQPSSRRSFLSRLSITAQPQPGSHSTVSKSVNGHTRGNGLRATSTVTKEVDRREPAYDPTVTGSMYSASSTRPETEAHLRSRGVPARDAASSHVTSESQTVSAPSPHNFVPTPMGTPTAASAATANPLSSSSRPHAVESPDRWRHPIHPALASHPNSPSRVHSPSFHRTGLSPTHLEPDNGSFPREHGRSVGESSPSMAEKRSEQNTGRRSLGPSSIALPPKNAYETITASPTMTPKARPRVSSRASPLSTRPLDDPSIKRSPISEVKKTRTSAPSPSRRSENPETHNAKEVLTSAEMQTSSPTPTGERRLSSYQDVRAQASRPSPVIAKISASNVQLPGGSPTGAAAQATPRARQPSSYFPPISRQSSAMDRNGLSEASAYAKAVASSLSMGQSVLSGDAAPGAHTERRSSRPLPQLPSLGRPAAPTKDVSPHPSKAAVQPLSSNDGIGRRDSSDIQKKGQRVSRKVPEDQSQTSHNLAPRSQMPTPDQANPKHRALQATDQHAMTTPTDHTTPRSSSLPLSNGSQLEKNTSFGLSDVTIPVEQTKAAMRDSARKLQVANDPKSLASEHQSDRYSSAGGLAPHSISSTRDSPTILPNLSTAPIDGLKQGGISTAPLQQYNAPGRESHMTRNDNKPTDSVYRRGKSRPSLALLLSQQRIQISLLPLLSINSFLSLTGASDVIRKTFVGETVGRWVTKEWNILVDRERGRSWPNLTVWEGFLESLLHNPSTYYTYPEQWHDLLQHLSLSHTLIVIHLRNLPASAFPNSAPLPFEDEAGVTVPQLPFSGSTTSLSSCYPARSRMSSAAASDADSITPATRMPRQERLVEIVMPEPLAPHAKEDVIANPSQESPAARKTLRRGSQSSMMSGASTAFGRKRSSSTATTAMSSHLTESNAHHASPMSLFTKTSLPPVSYPTAKRYGFTRHGDPTSTSGRSGRSTDLGRPESVFSIQSNVSSPHQRFSGTYNAQPSLPAERHPPSLPVLSAGLPVAPSAGGQNRASFAGSDAGLSFRRTEHGFMVPKQARWVSRDMLSMPPRIEPAFDRPSPYTLGRAPILRVFVPLSNQVRHWPSAEGARLAIQELDKCGATRRMRPGDIVVNTAIPDPQKTSNAMVFVPFVKHLLVPFEFTRCATGHLPSYIDAFIMPPSYYHSFLLSPQVIHLDLKPYAQQAMRSLRLAYDKRDLTVASGAKLSAKRYLHVAGFEVRPENTAAPEWHGMVSLEAEGTAEGKAEMEQRLGGGDPSSAMIGPWEVVREKSMMGTIWLRLVRDLSSPGQT